MKKSKNLIVSGFFGAAVTLLSASMANAAVITSSLGNTASGLSDGSTYTLFTGIAAAQSGQPAPFDQGCGFVLASCSATWTHSYAAIADTILSASLTLGIYDHRSASAGDQVANMDVDGTSLTAAANGLFEASGGAINEYNEYTFALSAGMFAGLADGTALVNFALQGPVDGVCGLFSPPPCPGTPPTDPLNPAHLIFSELTITTQDPGPGPDPVPVPGSLPLLALGGLLLGLSRRFRGANR